MATAPTPDTASDPKDLDELNSQIAAFVKTCYHNPLRFVMGAYPWRQEGTSLQHDDGPDVWQREFLIQVGEESKKRNFNGRDAVMPLLFAVSKGHGVGGSVMIAWLVDWIMSTRPDATGVVTANTNVQLQTKTWAAVIRWTKMCLTSPWFTINTARMYHKAYPESWFCTPQTCRAENSEAYAGQHARTSTSFYMFDEDSNIPAIIHTVAEGGMTDGEPMQFRFGNSTRNSGDFHDVIFGSQKEYWISKVIDSRTSRFTNKEQIARWAKQHGEDSDFFRVRVRGLPPVASDLQFIGSNLVHAAQKRPGVSFPDEPLIAGVDFSGGGQAWNVVRFRRGSDATMPAIRVPGAVTRDSRAALLGILAELLREKNPERRVAFMFCDSAFGAPYVERLKAMGFSNVEEIIFGDTHTPDPDHYFNMRAYMYGRCKEWLNRGAIPPKDDELESALCTPGFFLNNRDQIVIESKEDMAERNAPLVDDADALVLTFATPVAARRDKPKKPAGRQLHTGRGTPGGRTKWMG